MLSYPALKGGGLTAPLNLKGQGGLAALCLVLCIICLTLSYQRHHLVDALTPTPEETGSSEKLCDLSKATMLVSGGSNLSTTTWAPAFKIFVSELSFSE